VLYAVWEPWKLLKIAGIVAVVFLGELVKTILYPSQSKFVVRPPSGNMRNYGTEHFYVLSHCNRAASEPR